MFRDELTNHIPVFSKTVHQKTVIVWFFISLSNTIVDFYGFSFQNWISKMSMFADMTLQELNALAERQRRQIEEQEKSLQGNIDPEVYFPRSDNVNFTGIFSKTEKADSINTAISTKCRVG